ncbi:hypothetical protein [Hyphomicrobium sp. CS1GBMeth3]|uniref:hypothetical protein n=1 Tax=Hyphomicrobium sp. CS1GBMeth3 TaxID=1892845 RepID=UPI000A98F5FA|nr:hypothetical protein [Hyphomicrobium sp. CS1GBMeth3]
MTRAEEGVTRTLMTLRSKLLSGLRQGFAADGGNQNPKWNYYPNIPFTQGIALQLLDYDLKAMEYYSPVVYAGRWGSAWWRKPHFTWG